MKMTRRLSLAAAVAATVFAGSAAAQTSPATANLNVSANVAARCTVSTTDLAFGQYNPLAGTAHPGTGTVTVRCTRGSVPEIAMGNGTYFAGSTRSMQRGGGTELLNYSIFLPTNAPAYDSCGGTTPWNQTSPGNVLIPGAAANASARVFTVCGEIPVNANNTNALVGSYADLVQVSVSF